MSEERFEVIVIGGGLAGLSAAYRLSKAGKKVLVLEKGQSSGAKNVSGGRIYTYALDRLMGSDWKDAPLEREINQEWLMMMNEEDALVVNTTTNALAGQSYSVLRARFDKWLAEQVEKAGGLVICGACVDGLLRKDGVVCGVKVGAEEIECDLVIDAEGANALVAEREGVIAPVRAENMAVAAKYVIRLDEKTINERFMCESGKGVALLGDGAANKGLFGGLFMYTNKDTVSIGLVQDMNTWKENGKSLPDAMEDLKSHPVIGKYIDGGEVVEYTAHIIPEGGYGAFSEFCGDGILVTGDAAGLCMNRGFTVRGMDYAIMSGIAAADTAKQALDRGIFTKDFLKMYEARLQHNVLTDFKTLSKTHDYLANTEHMYTTYPNVAISAMQNLYRVDGGALKGAVKSVLGGIHDVNILSVAKDALKGVRSL
jgi:electron transfer flavoprotein-quinone oxidoreductase